MSKFLFIGIAFLLATYLFYLSDRTYLQQASVNHIKHLDKLVLSKTQKKLLNISSQLLSELGDKYGIGGTIFVALTILPSTDALIVTVAFTLSTAIWTS